jgi:excisionase family DNA binding protein
MNLIEASQYLGISKSGMYKYTHERRIPYHKMGKRVFFYTKDIDEWLKEQSSRVKSRAEIEKEANAYIIIKKVR